MMAEMYALIGFGLLWFLVLAGLALLAWATHD